jgi:hypothetical protein
MFSIPSHSNILFAVTEVLIIMLLGFFFTNIYKIEWLKLLCLSFLQGIIAVFITDFFMPFGISTFILIPTLIALVRIFLKIPVPKASVIVLLGTFLDGIIQGIVLSLLLLFHVDMLQFHHDFKMISIAFFSFTLLAVLLLMISKRKSLFILNLQEKH